MEDSNNSDDSLQHDDHHGVPDIHEHDGEQDQFIEYINNGYLSIQIYKLRDGHIDLIWDL